MRLFYRISEAWDAGERRGAGDVMRSLGISWDHVETSTVAETHRFDGCTNVPDELPTFIDREKVKE